MSSDKNSITSQQNLTAAGSRIQKTYEFEDFRLDVPSLMLYKGGGTVALKPKAVETLVALLDRAGEVVSKEELMGRLWGDSFVEESNLTQNIYLLRKCLGNCPDGQPFIENFARRGYRFNGKLRSPAAIQIVLATHTETKTVVEEESFRASPARPIWVVPTAAVAAVLGALVFALSQFNAPGNSSSAKQSAGAFEKFTLKRHSDSNDVTNGVISHDGKFIAHMRARSAMWLKNTGTEDAIEILPPSDTILRSVISFSPDDNYIYFFNTAEDKKPKLARVSVVGGTVERMNVGDAWSGASLSPDGSQLAFIRRHETSRQVLIIANTDGSGEHEAVINEEGEWLGLWSHSTSWSPDGKRIAVAGGTTTNGKAVSDIKIFNASDGARISTIPSGPDWRWIDAVLWLPGGDELLAIAGDNTSQGQIYKHTISTGEWRRVTNDLSNYVSLSVTADGKTVVTVQHENPGNLWLLPSDGDVSRAKQITSGRNLMTDVTGVSWTPDGSIVYATNSGSGWEIRMIDPDGGNQKELTRNCAGNESCNQPVVSPDGRYIVFQARREGVPHIWRMEADGGNPTQLTVGGGFAPSITPDGRFVIFTWYSPGEKFWRIPIEGGTAEEFSQMTSVGNISLSPDGKQMAFDYFDETAKEQFQTCVAAVGAAAPDKCFGISRSFPRWAPDGKAFYYLDHSYLGIWKQRLDGERKMFLEFPGERTNNFAFSPDGKHIAVARSKPTQDIVALTDER
ncbi:MAG TPA: winged helix-turn-helix domain-containing protein [Pyrinomonadaceae bacterium]|nr:winged helix-turn-helix domain-containing protein [Pyrinomonadaceae bacterium]